MGAYQVVDRAAFYRPPPATSRHAGFTLKLSAGNEDLDLNAIVSQIDTYHCIISGDYFDADGLSHGDMIIIEHGAAPAAGKFAVMRGLSGYALIVWPRGLYLVRTEQRISNDPRLWGVVTAIIKRV